MGCANSKLDDLPAVALCRERCVFLDEAIRLRYVLSQSHLAYTHSLKTVGSSLNRFFVRDLDHFTAEPPSPVLNLPVHRKGDPQPSSNSPPDKTTSPVLNLHSHPKSATHRHSHSNSGSHLHFHSDEDDDSDGHHDDDDSPSGSLHHHLHDDLYSDDGPSSSPHRYGHLTYPDTDSLGFPGPYPTSYPGGAGTFMHMNYMRNQTTPSVSYQQRPISPEIVRMGMIGEASSSNSNPSSYYPHPYSQPSQDPYTPAFLNYTNYGTSGFPSSSPMPAYYASSSSAPPIGPSSSKEPPPPPSPPRASAWEFLNPFESYDKYYTAYTPSRDSREVREEESIPDLEEEDYQQEVVKEIHGDQKFVDGGSNAGAKLSYSKASLDEDEDGKGDNNSEAMYRTRPSVGMDVESDAAEYEVHMVDKKVVHDDERSGVRTNAAGFKARGAGLKGDSEVVREIQFQFERASESGNELAKILEVGKLPYNRKHAAYQAKGTIFHRYSCFYTGTPPSLIKSSY